MEGEKLRRTRTDYAARMRTHIMNSLTIESEGRPKPGLIERLAAFLRRQCGEERLNGGALLSRGHQREIIVLLGERNEAKARCMRDRRDGHAPVGTMLGDRGRNRVM